MIVRELWSIYYFTPVVCGWVDEDTELFTLVFAWFCWSIEHTFFEQEDK